MRIRCSVLVLVLSAIPVLPCAADDRPAGVSAPTNREPIVVTATRTSRGVSEVPASVSVVSKEDIGNSPAVNVDDALRAQPGMTVMRTTGIGNGMPVQILIRGVPGDHRTLLLVDGMPLNEANTGFLSLNEIPLQAVNQVEVIRGPFSCLYGTDAFAGVVNVLTSDGGDDPETTVSAAAGNAGYRTEGISHSGGSGKARYFFNLDHRSIDNYLGRDYTIDRRYDYALGKYVDTVKDAANYDYSDSRFFGKMTFDLGEKSHLAVHARFYEGELGYGQTEAPNYPHPEDSDTKTRTALIGGVFTRELSDGADLKLGAYYRDQKREVWGLDFSHSSGTLPVYVRSLTENSGREWMAEGGIDTKVGSGHTISGGIDLRGNSADFSAIADAATGVPLPGAEGAEPNVWNAGAYIQDEAAPAKNLKLVLGTRLDHHSEFGDVLSPKAGVLYGISPETDIRASAGRAFRAPTMVEMFQPRMTFGYLAFESNPKLKPEYINAYDVQIEHRFLKNLSGRVAAFYNDMDDLIENQVHGDVLTNENINKARSKGIEGELKWKMSELFDAAVTYTLQDAEDVDTGADLDYIPENMGSLTLRAHGNVGRWKLEGNVTELYVGSRGFLNWDSGQWYPMDEYWRTDVSVKGTFNETFWLGVGVQNATDEKYQESRMSVLGPGRLYAFEAGARF